MTATFPMARPRGSCVRPVFLQEAMPPLRDRAALSGVVKPSVVSEPSVDAISDAHKALRRVAAPLM
jgi:hypothetical protein